MTPLSGCCTTASQASSCNNRFSFSSPSGLLAFFNSAGIGKPTGKGLGVTYRGAIYYQTKSAKLARLNGTCVIFEYEVDEQGGSRAQLWEWK